MNYRLLILPLCFMGVLTGGARHMNPSQAWQRAVMSNEATARRIPAAITPSPSLTINDPAGAGSVYLFNYDSAGEKRFVLLPSEDSALPVLAYGDGNFDESSNIPPAMQEWLEMYARQLSYAAANKLPVYKSSETANKEEIPPLLTCSWDQMYPYNLFTPAYNNTENCATGCVATAIAQVMHYHKYPPKGVGNNSYTDIVQGEEVTLSADFGNTEYEWSNMLDSYADDTATQTQKEAVARLMADVGVAVNMDYALYGINTSGVTTSEIYPRIVKYFGYSPSVTGDHKIYHTDQGWETKVYNNLKECGPLVYSGNNGTSGHCFVCDGYKEGMFHFNWGWSGAHNGYFSLSALTPGAGGTGAGGGQYSMDQFAIFGIRPPKAGDKPNVYIQARGSLSFSNPTYSIPSTMTVALNRSLHPGYFNLVPEESTIQFGLMFTDTCNGNYYVLTDTPKKLGYKYGIESFDVSISLGDIPPGDYVMRPAARLAEEENEGAWCEIDMNISSIRAYNVTVYNNYLFINSVATVEEGDKASTSIPKVHQLKVTDASYSGKTETGAAGTLYASLTNNKIAYEGEIRLNLIDSNGEVSCIGSLPAVSVPANGEAEITIPCTMHSEAGKYFLVLTDKEGTHFYEQAVEITKGETSIEKIETNETALFRIWPNPASSYIHIEGIETGESVEIYDLTGRRISTSVFEGAIISTENLTPGMYLISAGGQTARLIVK